MTPQHSPSMSEQEMNVACPHPQSRASLLALHQQLHAESYARTEVYSRMANKLWMDWIIQRVAFGLRCFNECLPRIAAATGRVQN